MAEPQKKPSLPPVVNAGKGGAIQIIVFGEMRISSPDPRVVVQRKE